MKQRRPYSPAQSFLLPPSPHDWLEEGHLAYFILDVMDKIDLRGINAEVDAKDARGQRPYEPKLMMALLIYGYCTGTCSSRRIAKATCESIPFRVLAGGCHPHFTNINTFRRNYLSHFRNFFLQVLLLCQQAGLVKLGHVALDGTKIQGNASKHKAMGYGRVLKKEAELKEQIDQLLARAQSEDDAEDKFFGDGKDDTDLPSELKRRKDRLAAIDAAKGRLEQQAKKTRIAELIVAAERKIASTKAAKSKKGKSQSEWHRC